jgi:hypothetical protein
MNIKNISRPDFDQLLPQDANLKHLIAEQLEWFSNSAGTMLGTVGTDKHVSGWIYVILKQDKDGQFHVYKIMNNCFPLECLRDDLLISMAELAIEQPDLCVPLGRD